VLHQTCLAVSPILAPSMGRARIPIVGHALDKVQPEPSTRSDSALGGATRTLLAGVGCSEKPSEGSF
jgi:hypothetical protein